METGTIINQYKIVGFNFVSKSSFNSFKSCQTLFDFFQRNSTVLVGVFVITKPIDGNEATYANGATIGFSAKSIADVDAFYASGITHGGNSCEGEPGYREGAAGTVYIFWLRDPVGNKICAMYRPPK